MWLLYELAHGEFGHPFSSAKLEAGANVKAKRWHTSCGLVVLPHCASLEMPENRKDRPPKEQNSEGEGKNQHQLNQKDMANYCDSTYRIGGEASELDTLYNLMLKLQDEKENGNWVGHIVEALNGSIPQHLYTRGWWDDIEREEDCIRFHLESAWEPLYEAFDFICSKYKTLTAYFIGEEPGCEVYLKRDNELYAWFPDNYYLDAKPPKGDYVTEYFIDIHTAFRYIEKLDDVNIITVEDIEAFNLTWQEEDENAYIYLHEFKEV